MGCISVDLQTRCWLFGALGLAWALSLGLDSGSGSTFGPSVAYLSNGLRICCFANLMLAFWGARFGLGFEFGFRFRFWFEFWAFGGPLEWWAAYLLFCKLDVGMLGWAWFG